MEIALGLLVLLAEHAIGRGELGHDQPAPTQVADETPEDRVSNASHRRQHSGGRNADIADGYAGGDRLQTLYLADNRARPTRVVPGLSHTSILLAPAKQSPRRLARAEFTGLSGLIRGKDLVLRRRLGGLGRRVLGVLAAEALHSSGSIHQLLLARKERMAGRADFYADITLVGGPGNKRIAARAMHAHFVISGMNGWFHIGSDLNTNP